MSQKFEVIVYLESHRFICDTEKQAELEADHAKRIFNENAYTVIREIEGDEEEDFKVDCIH